MYRNSGNFRPTIFQLLFKLRTRAIVNFQCSNYFMFSKFVVVVAHEN